MTPVYFTVPGIPVALTAERLREVLDYDPKTGVFRWKIASGPRAVVGAVAGCIDRKGYRRIKVDGAKHAAHRLAWLYVTGQFPADQIDHRNRLRDDNRFINLRQATGSENGANSIYAKRKHGALKGAYRTPQGTWQSVIVKGGRRLHLGTFPTELEAHRAYSQAAQRLHGAFARVSP